MQPVKDEWSDEEEPEPKDDEDYVFLKDLVGDSGSKSRRRGRSKTRALAVVTDGSVLDRDLTCTICSETVFGFHESVLHMSKKHRDKGDTSEKVKSENAHLIPTGKYHCMADLLFDWFGFSCLDTD